MRLAAASAWTTLLLTGAATGQADPEIAAKIADLAGDSRQARRAAVQWLVAKGAPAAPALIELLRDKGRFPQEHPDIVGKSIQLDGASFTVVGVMDEQYPLETDFWLPLSHLSQVDLTSRRHHSVQAIGRLKPGVTIEQARQEMETIAERLRQLYPATNQKIGVELTPLRNQLVGNLRPIVLLVFAAVGLILLIACANVSNLLLAQSAGRQRELAIRSAPGQETTIEVVVNENIQKRE